MKYGINFNHFSCLMNHIREFRNLPREIRVVHILKMRGFLWCWITWLPFHGTQQILSMEHKKNPFQKGMKVNES